MRVRYCLERRVGYLANRAMLGVGEIVGMKMKRAGNKCGADQQEADYPYPVPG